jgi:hypothetical protein
MFRDEVQAARAIHLLLERFGVEAAWTDPELPPQKRALVRAAWSLWSPIAGGIALGDVVLSLDREACAALCSLMVAYAGGAEEVDAWIDDALSSLPPGGARASLEPAEPDPSKPLSSIFEDWPTLDLLSVRYVRRVLGHAIGCR